MQAVEAAESFRMPRFLFFSQDRKEVESVSHPLITCRNMISRWLMLQDVTEYIIDGVLPRPLLWKKMLLVSFTIDVSSVSITRRSTSSHVIITLS